MSLERRVEALELKVGFLGEQVARYNGILEKEEKQSVIGTWAKMAEFAAENKAVIGLIAIPYLKLFADLWNFLVGLLHKIPTIPHGGI